MELFSSWTGSDFLLFYSGLLLLASLAAWSIPALLRDPGRSGEAGDFEGIAVLAGGAQRLTDSLLADLHVRRAIDTTADGKLIVTDPNLPASPAGKDLLTRPSPVTLAEARRVIAVHAERSAARLRRSGLMLRDEDLSRLRWLSIAPFGVLLMIGIYRQRAGSALGEPTGFLVILLVLTVVLALIRFARFDARTRAGIAEVKRLRKSSSRLSRAPQGDEVPVAVALFGTGVLVGTPWEPLHAMRQKDGDSGSSGDSSGDGGSGCGGGCGGCGG